MPEQKRTDHTLPSVVASPSRGIHRQVLMISIVFHPDTSRIGETACFEKLAGEASRILGRQTPMFQHFDEKVSSTPLNDPYVSKEALRISYTNGSIILGRESSSSRARVGGCELAGEVRLSSAQLATGVPIILGGRVVLLLRRSAQFTPTSKSSRHCRSMRGSSAYMGKLREQIVRLASTDLDVLIRGETGTGKELVAEALHAASELKSRKMVAVNMAAIPAALAPTLLFGSAKGAFTGSDKATAGYFEQAGGSTLFLDEIGDTLQEVQAQLLRALQQREIQILGGAIKKVSLRVISATDAQLDEQSCNFKGALRHRLAESEIFLLPLTQHPEDIGELLWIFLESSMKSMARGHVLPSEISRANEIAMWAELFHQFVAYSWPGNIRELNNYAQQVALASEEFAAIPEVVLERLSGSVPGVVDNVEKTTGPTATIFKSEDYSDQEFMAGYKKARYEVQKTARQLGISRQAVYRRISDSPDLCLAGELSDDQIRSALQTCGGDLGAAAMQLKVSKTALRERIRTVPMSRAG